MARRNKIHIGSIIKKVFEHSGMSITEFARRINCTRPNVYSIFERHDIGVEQLIEISIALNHNFLDDIYEQTCLNSSLIPTHLMLKIDVSNIEPILLQRFINVLSDINEK